MIKNIIPLKIAEFFGYQSLLIEETLQGYSVVLEEVIKNRNFYKYEIEVVLDIATNYNYVSIIDLIIDNFSVDYNYKEGIFIYYLARNNNWQHLEKFLKKVDSKHILMNRALNVAAFKNSYECFVMLLNAGANIEYKNFKALKLASSNNHYKILEYAHENKINILDNYYILDFVKYDNLDFLLFCQKNGYSLDNNLELFSLACYLNSEKIINYLFPYYIDHEDLVFSIIDENNKIYKNVEHKFSTLENYKNLIKSLEIKKTKLNKI